MFSKISLLLLLVLCTRAFGLEETEETASSGSLTSTETKDYKSEESVEDKVPDSEPTKENPQGISICGFKNSDTIGSTTNEFPWMVGIFSRGDGADVPKLQICGGALIDPSVVLTSAHCVHQFKGNHNNIEIQIGFKEAVETKTIKRFIILDHFEQDYHLNGLAILILNEPFELRANIKPICIPPVTANFDQGNCLLLHYNSTYENGYDKFDVKISSINDCNSKLRQLNRLTELPLHESIICTISSVNEKLCRNMLGSPLICPIVGMENRYYLAGVASFENACSTDVQMNLFVNVALFQRWIEYHLKTENIGNEHFTAF